MANIKITDLTSASALSGTELLELVQSGANRKATVADLATRAGLRGQIFGLTLSNNGTDATNDIDIAAGEAASDASSAVLMVLAATLTKRLDAAWAVGSGNGGLDTGSIANTTYHVWLIQRSDTGVVDALFSTSATSPTMPTSYDRKRRIGSIIRAAGAIRAFTQVGDVFKYATSVLDYSSASSRANALLTLSVPAGLRLSPMLYVSLYSPAGLAANLVSSGGFTDAQYRLNESNNNTNNQTSAEGVLFTNTSAQVNLQVLIFSGVIVNNDLYTMGWYDRRGKDL